MPFAVLVREVARREVTQHGSDDEGLMAWLSIYSVREGVILDVLVRRVALRASTNLKFAVRTASN